MPALAKKRILIVDDAVVVRKMLADALSANGVVEVAGVAANGRIALQKFLALKPDVILLDIEMPDMDGLETVRELRKLDTRVPIIMFSTLTERGAGAALEALSLGATDYVTKPSNSDMRATLEVVSRELIPKVLALCGVAEVRVGIEPARKPPVLALAVSRRLPTPVEVVAIGVSTGGPDALARLLPALPADFPVPIIIVQHMPPIFTRLLAARLSAKSALPVRECKSGELLTPGCAVLAPGDFHMVASKEGGTVCLRTQQGPKENYCRPSVDVLFRSVAKLYGAKTLAVVLTGMGQDGLKGCGLLQGLGARIVVQDEASSVVWGMPGLVARAGLAEKILPLDQIGAEIVRSAAPHADAALARAGAV